MVGSVGSDPWPVRLAFALLGQSLGKFSNSKCQTAKRWLENLFRKMFPHISTLLFSSLQCYYIGATNDAATKIINEVSKPMSHHIPVEKICDKLKKKDSQICELKYGELPAERGNGCTFLGY